MMKIFIRLTALFVLSTMLFGCLKSSYHTYQEPTTNEKRSRAVIIGNQDGLGKKFYFKIYDPKSREMYEVYSNYKSRNFDIQLPPKSDVIAKVYLYGDMTTKIEAREKLSLEEFFQKHDDCSDIKLFKPKADTDYVISFDKYPVDETTYCFLRIYKVIRDGNKQRLQQISK